MIPRDQKTDNFTKQESNTTSSDHHNARNNNNNFMASSSSPTTTSTTTSWSRLKDPRIVRVSRAFGGKDRHSKVFTVRGLRDRRVRLSVPTAIQLYDLQDRLGLNQPSKVVDWLLNAAKHEIDELPPLQIPPGTFSSQINLQPMLTNSDHLHELGGASQSSAKQSLNIFGGKLKEVSGENATSGEEIRQFNLENQAGGYVNNPSSSSLSSLMNSSYNSFVRWDPSNLTLSRPPRSSLGSTAQHEDWHNFSLVPLQPTNSHVPSGSHDHHHHQVLVYQPGMSITQSYFPNSQNIENFQNSPVESTSTQPVRPIHFNMSTANLLPSQNNEGRS